MKLRLQQHMRDLERTFSFRCCCAAKSENPNKALIQAHPKRELGRMVGQPNYQILFPRVEAQATHLACRFHLPVVLPAAGAAPAAGLRRSGSGASLAVTSSQKLLFRSTGTMDQEQKWEAPCGIYTYKHHCSMGVDVHEIFVKKSSLRVVLSYIGVVFLLVNVSQPLLAKESLSLGSVWNITFAILVAKCLQYKPVKKESVVIMPAFGVQLEIHFWSGRVDRRFVPIGKILKPLINECVTPVTCYWSLALLLRDEEELLLVFQKCRPPVKMLVPVWKALCTLTNSERLSPSRVDKPNSLEK